MTYWSGRAAGNANLRLYMPTKGWQQYEDRLDATGKIESVGSGRAIDLSLTTALNASNLLLLTGAGSSFCAKNDPAKLSAPSMVDLWNAVSAAATPKVMAAVIAAIPGASALTTRDIEKLLTLCKMFITLFDNPASKKIKAFIATAEKAILERANFVDDVTDISSHRVLVRKIARRGAKKPRAKIFTTNYDLCFEYAALQQQFVVIDGFSHSLPQIYDRAHFSYDIVRRETGSDAPDYIENVFHLYKLHGSLDWRKNGAIISRSRDLTTGDPVLIYPRDSKFQETFEPPYLDMMGTFQSALREPDTSIIISGFGFNDDHLSNPIMAALEANMSLRLVLCDVGFIEEAQLTANPEVVPSTVVNPNEGKFFTKFRKLAELGDSRITLLNARFEDLALVMPDLVAQTERERHVDRMHKLGLTP